MHRHPKRAPFLAALPHSAPPGSLLKRFVATPLETRVIAKTGSIDRVNSLSGYIERPDGRTITFSIQANAHARSEEHTSELQSHHDLVCRLLLEKKKNPPPHH